MTKNYSRELGEKIKACGASLVEEISLNLEEIFIYSFGGEGVYAELTQ
ncbi:MAG: hypothetical protein ACOYWZ_17840 [Bacillota bacterium]